MDTVQYIYIRLQLTTPKRELSNHERLMSSIIYVTHFPYFSDHLNTKYPYLCLMCQCYSTSSDLKKIGPHNFS